VDDGGGDGLAGGGAVDRRGRGEGTCGGVHDQLAVTVDGDLDAALDARLDERVNGLLDGVHAWCSS
jgi:hypothetical protein